MSMAFHEPLVAPTAWAVMLVLAPAAEEIVFRGGLQDALMRRLRGRVAGADAIALVATALAFAAAHVLARGSSSAWLVFAPALLIGLAYARWRRLDACIGLHAAANALWLPAAAYLS
jgi:membrane protease YdiL (CAAX protease family)